MKTKPMAILKNGLFNENPTFRLVLGMCPTLAITRNMFNGIGMGLAATFVLVGSNSVISLLRSFIPDKVRIPAYVVVIAAFVTIVQLLLKAYMPALDDSLGLFIPLIVVNCIILGRAEAFAGKNSLGASFLDGVGMGLGFTGALLLVSFFREVLGNGSLFGFELFGKGFEPVRMMIQPPGGFITLGLLLGAINKISMFRKHRKGAH
ncbi:MAG: electron transport complex subunit E [Christensenellales bacterium]